MRIFAFIMATLILIMSCTPCQDAPATSKSSHAATTLATATDHEHDPSADDCSPLCTCACCSAHSCPQSFITAASHTANTTLTHASCYNGNLISVSLPIWQPPQLVA